MYRYGYTHINKMHKTLMEGKKCISGIVVSGGLGVMGWGEAEDFAYISSCIHFKISEAKMAKCSHLFNVSTRYISFYRSLNVWNSLSSQLPAEVEKVVRKRQLCIVRCEMHLCIIYALLLRTKKGGHGRSLAGHW